MSALAPGQGERDGTHVASHGSMTAATQTHDPESASSDGGAPAGAKPRIADLLDAAVRFARARPYPAIAAALVAGFVVGGALSFRAGRVLLAAGGRQLGQELLKQLL
jgi:hypothetical protein